MNRPNWDILLIRVGFVLILSAFAAVFHPFNLPVAASAAWMVCAAGAVIFLELRLRKAGLKQLMAAWLGLFAGALVGLIFVFLLTAGASLAEGTAGFVRIAIPLIAGYLGMISALAKSDQLPRHFLGLRDDGGPASAKKILDTSVLIDGRIADIAEAGFLDGVCVVTQFVLHELQLVADSSDSIKRTRGRRGLDIVQRLQKITQIRIEVSGEDFPDLQQVDLKLIEWAKRHEAKIVTNDFNLNKLAQVQGIAVLNINELANALRPVVLPGETMRVFVLKEGKEYNQGVAYLDDGTMVVIDNARRSVSKTVDITVTSVLQTTAGKMIFGKYDERPHSAAAGQSR